MKQPPTEITQQRAALLALLIEQAEQGDLPLPDAGTGYPLSDAQQRLWFVEQLEGTQVTYNFPSAVLINGRFDPQIYRQSLQLMVQRHKILTATFVDVDGIPRQRFHADHQVQMPLVDLTMQSPAQQDDTLKEMFAAEANATFSLAQGPLYHCNVIKLADEKHVLLMNQHHIITDGWSSSLFNREVSEYYAALIEQSEAELPPPTLEYSDYVYWQQEVLDSEAKTQWLGYWRSQLARMQTLKLPLDRPRSEQLTSRGAHHLVNIASPVSAALKQLAQQQGASLYMVLLSAYKVMLYSYFQQTDIVVGTSSANRKIPELEQVLGLFVNQLVLRTSLAGNPPFAELIQRVKETTTAAFAHQDLPFDSLVSAMDVSRKAGESVLFQTLFLFNNFPRQALDPSASVQLQTLDIDINSARFDLSLTVEERETLSIKFTYRSDLFDSSTIERMSERYLAVITAIVNNPNAHLSQIDGEINMQPTQPASAAKTSRFKRGRRASVSLSAQQMVTIKDQPGQFPLLIEPASDNVELAEWISLKREFLEQKISQSGAILFRGFGIDSAQKFERMANAYCPQLFGGYGDLPPEAQGKQIYKSTPYPNDKAIMFHNEGSHTRQWPMKQMFGGIIAAQSGGETPIVDCRKVYRALDPQIIAKLAEKKLMYVRNFIAGLDVSWQDFFKTAERAEVEQICRQDGVECEWLSDEHLRTRQIADAVCLHPKSGEKLFFNQIQLHHIAYMDAAERESLLTLFSKQDLPRNVYYGDGSDIEAQVLAQIDRAYDENALISPWQQGDFVVLDNMLVAHGRMAFTGPRKVVVAMGDLINRDAVVTGEHP